MRPLFTSFISLTFLLIPSVFHAKNVDLEQLSGKSVSFDSLKGRWIFINYWASWCQPCLEEIPHLNSFYQNTPKNQMALFAVNYEGLSKKKQTVLAHQFNLKYPSLSSDPASLLQLGNIQVLPVTFVFNPKGELHEILYGGQTKISLSAYLKRKDLRLSLAEMEQL